MTITLDDTLAHVSEQPWSDYKESDYSIEQWHRACLIHQHDGAPTSKSQCKLPVRTPDGTLNRNGVHAAAAALAGARGGVQASTEEKASAGKALVRFYRELDEDAPASLLEHSAIPHELSHYVSDEDELDHSGVKGMKWGVRNDKGHEGEAVKTKKLGKLDKKWEKENTGTKGYVKAYNNAADRMNKGEIQKINNEPRWKKAADDGVLLDDNHPETQAYFKAYEDRFNQVFAEESVKLGSNPSGTKAYELREDSDGNPYGFLAPVKKNVQHADNPEFALKLNRDRRGLVKSVTTTQSMLHGEEFVDEFLEHHGVKGMKWGVTTKHPSGALSKRAQKKAKKMQPTDVQVSQKKPGTRVSSTGGRNQPAHEDAVRAAALKQKAKSSTTDALSNSELQSLTQRMNLEQNYASLQSRENQARQSSGKKFVKGLLGSATGIGKSQAESVVSTQLAYEVDKQLSSHGRPVKAKSQYKFKED